MSETPSEERRDGGSDAPIANADDDPFGELAEIDDPDTDIDIDELFEEMDTPEIDEDEVWEALFSDADPSALGPHPDVPAPGAEGMDAVVEKDRYCQRCEYFSEPPDVACTNPETEIVELVGVDRFRLRNCPVVAHRRQAKSVLPDQE